MWGKCPASWLAGTNWQMNPPPPNSKFTEFSAEEVVESHSEAKDYRNSRFFITLLDLDLDVDFDLDRSFQGRELWGFRT